MTEGTNRTKTSKTLSVEQLEKLHRSVAEMGDQHGVVVAAWLIRETCIELLSARSLAEVSNTDGRHQVSTLIDAGSSPAGRTNHEYVDCPQGTGCPECYGWKPTPHETLAAPAAVLQWAVNSFGAIALNRDERAARMTEEAIEVAQVEGVPLEVIQRIAARVYSRPVGELGQEIGGLMVGLYALAANSGVDPDAEFRREFDRVLSKPREHWARKHAEKVAAGTADLSPTHALKATAVSCVWREGCRLKGVCEKEGRCMGSNTLNGLSGQ